MKKRWMRCTVITAMGILMMSAPCGFAASDTTRGATVKPKIVLKVAQVMPKGSCYDEGLVKFKEVVEKDSNGTIEVQVFSDGILGGEREMIEGMQTGTIDATVTTAAPYGGFIPKIMVLDLPFLFRNTEHAMKVVNGPVGKRLLEGLDKKNIVALSWANFGFRHLTNNKHPVKAPADLKGLKIRTMQNNVLIETWKVLGAQPTPMSITEVFTALQTGVVDGQENPITAIKNNRFYEVQKYLSLTGHVYSASIFSMSKITYDKLTDAQKQVIKKAGVEAAKQENMVFDRDSLRDLELMKSRGLQVNEVEKEKFVEATKSIYAKYEKDFTKELIEQIRNTK